MSRNSVQVIWCSEIVAFYIALNRCLFNFSYLTFTFRTVCNRTYYGDVGRTYSIQVPTPQWNRIPFLCHLTFTASGHDQGDIVQVRLNRKFLLKIWRWNFVILNFPFSAPQNFSIDIVFGFRMWEWNVQKIWNVSFTRNCLHFQNYLFVFKTFENSL